MSVPAVSTLHRNPQASSTDLQPPEPRRLIEDRYKTPNTQGVHSLTISSTFSAFSAGLPREPDMVCDARFLRNPFCDTILSPLTGLDRSVVGHAEADPDDLRFLDRIDNLLRLLLPRFITEGKKYAAVACGCSGGRHRSVAVVEALAHRLDSRRQGWASRSE